MMEIRSDEVEVNSRVGFAATDLSARLQRLGLLRSRLDWLGIRGSDDQAGIAALLRGRPRTDLKPISEADLELLSRWGLVRWSDSPEPAARPLPTLPFVVAVNIELTYECNYMCSHCLQNGSRQSYSGQWIDTEIARRAIEHAWFAGLLRAGLNLTGGEPVHAASNLPELLETARGLNVPVRLNTNGWWGEASGIRVGDRKFGSAAEFVRWLREGPTQVLALSMDSRYVRDGVPWKPVATIIELCESEGLAFEMVSTGGMTRQEIEHMQAVAGADRDLFPIVSVDPVDIGCGRRYPFDAASTRWHDLEPPPCAWRGFYAPAFLHIEPGGGVRTCMYAPGSGSLGNLHREDLLSIINRFNRNHFVEIFRRGSEREFISKYVNPYAMRYRQPRDPCARAAIVSRVTEGVLRTRAPGTRGGHPQPTSEQLFEIHEQVASEYGLVVADPTKPNESRQP
jgi:MoaA/NifB/PqqE/SkfB family radical SAM enzyme